MIRYLNIFSLKFPNFVNAIRLSESKKSITPMITCLCHEISAFLLIAVITMVQIANVYMMTGILKLPRSCHRSSKKYRPVKQNHCQNKTRRLFGNGTYIKSYQTTHYQWLAYHSVFGKDGKKQQVRNDYQ